MIIDHVVSIAIASSLMEVRLSAVNLLHTSSRRSLAIFVNISPRYVEFFDINGTPVIIKPSITLLVHAH
jgi:hypothetical protein